MRQIALALVAAAIMSTPLLASDELSTGGLILARHPNLEVTSQELAISASEISARYRVQNTSDRAVSVLATFPMPEIAIEGADDAPALPTDDPINLLAVAVVVNGKPISPAVEQRVIAAGLDRTQLLRSLGIPFAPHLSSTREVVDRLPADRVEELRGIGLIDAEPHATAAGMQNRFAPRWALQTTFFWEESFAANSETVIELRYKPSVGRSDRTLLGSANQAKESWYEEYDEKYCFGHEFLAAVERARKATNSNPGAPFAEQRLDYAHKTWITGLASPMKEFRLTVDKGGADNLVSLCEESARKTSETEIEVKKTNYTPDGSLSILFLSKLPQQ